MKTTELKSHSDSNLIINYKHEKKTDMSFESMKNVALENQDIIHFNGLSSIEILNLKKVEIKDQEKSNTEQKNYEKDKKRKLLHPSEAFSTSEEVLKASRLSISPSNEHNHGRHHNKNKKKAIDELNGIIVY